MATKYKEQPTICADIVYYFRPISQRLESWDALVLGLRSFPDSVGPTVKAWYYGRLLDESKKKKLCDVIIT